MRELTMAFILVCFSISSMGKTNKDSLWLRWENQSLDDKERLLVLHQICSPQYLFSNPDSAFQFAELAYQFAKEKDLKKEMALASHLMGIASSHLSDFENAITLFNQSIKINQSINERIDVAKSLNSLGNVFLKKSNYTTAIDYYRQSLKVFEEEKKEEAIATLKNNIGLVYYDLKDFDKSLRYLNEALIICRRLQNENGIANTLINIGSIYRLQKEYTEALAFYTEALMLKKRNNIIQGTAICYSNIGLIYQAQHKVDEAKKYFKQSLGLHQKVGNKKEIANCLLYFGGIYLEENDLDSTIYLASQALSIAKETENKVELSKAAEMLYKAYEADDQHEKALTMHKLFQKTQDSIFSFENQKIVFEDESKYETEKETVQNHRQTKLERVTFFSLLLLVSGFFYFLWKRKKREVVKEREDLLSKIESLKRQLATSQSIITVEKRKEFKLDKDKIEEVIGAKLGVSSWLILNIIFQDPSINNKDIASQVSLSLEGVSSSLRRMYNKFEIQSSSNKKVALIMKVIRISMSN